MAKKQARGKVKNMAKKLTCTEDEGNISTKASGDL